MINMSKFQMSAEKKQEILYNRLLNSGNLNERYIDEQIANKTLKIKEIEYDITQIKMISPIQIGYIKLFKAMSHITPSQKIIANINIPTLQIQTAAFNDTLYELIDELEQDVKNLQVIRMKIVK